MQCCCRHRHHRCGGIPRKGNIEAKRLVTIIMWSFYSTYMSLDACVLVFSHELASTCINLLLLLFPSDGEFHFVLCTAEQCHSLRVYFFVCICFVAPLWHGCMQYTNSSASEYETAANGMACRVFECALWLFWQVLHQAYDVELGQQSHYVFMDLYSAYVWIDHFFSR